MATLTTAQIQQLDWLAEAKTYPNPITYPRQMFETVWQTIENWVTGGVTVAPSTSLVAAVNAAIASFGVTLTTGQVVFALKIWAAYRSQT